MAIREVENLKSINRKQSCGNLESQTEGMDFFWLYKHGEGF